MTANQSNTKPTIVLGVQFGPALQPLLDAARDICLKINGRLRLVHAIEPWFGTSWSAMAIHEPGMVDLFQTYEGQSMTQAGEELTRLAKTLPKELEVSVNTILGRSVDAIISDAMANQASLIITGAAASSHRFIPKGFSTALTLMSESPIPVLVITENARVDVKASDLSMMIADDLAEGSVSAVQRAYDWASRLGVRNLHHLHINNLSPELLKSSLETALATAHSTSVLTLPPQEVFDSVVKRLQDRLNERSRLARESSKGSFAKVDTVIRTGETSAMVSEASKASGAQILAFGRHKTIHKHPFYIGRFPFSSMLGEGKPVLVIPIANG